MYLRKGFMKKKSGLGHMTSLCILYTADCAAKLMSMMLMVASRAEFIVLPPCFPFRMMLQHMGAWFRSGGSYANFDFLQLRS